MINLDVEYFVPNILSIHEIMVKLKYFVENAAESVKLLCILLNTH